MSEKKDVNTDQIFNDTVHDIAIQIALSNRNKWPYEISLSETDSGDPANLTHETQFTFFSPVLNEKTIALTSKKK